MWRTKKSGDANQRLRESALPAKAPGNAATHYPINRCACFVWPVYFEFSQRMRALLKISKYQCTMDLLIKKALFVHFVRDIAHDFSEGIRFSPAMLEALHWDV